MRLLVMTLAGILPAGCTTADMRAFNEGMEMYQRRENVYGTPYYKAYVEGLQTPPSKASTVASQPQCKDRHEGRATDGHC